MSRELVAGKLQPPAPSVGDSKSYGGIKSLAIGAIASGGLPHAGLFYRWKKELRLFEMTDHEKLSDELARPGFVFIEPAIGPERARLIVNRARLVLDCHKDNAVPYGFGYRRSSFDEKGACRLGVGEIGFTCSTIVAAILESEGVPLIKPESWPLPDEPDKTTRRNLIKHVAKTKPAHADALLKDIEAPRISPDEVVAAAALYPPSGTFDTLQDGAAVVRERIGT